ncbi:hypothetical protein F511_23019 [Dorcoceras hygrometricum]|uniref:Uncharacterized protein n=1 Tax=Dorcoceras hygrometricum TaxID=472368 RepID=A0A2Z7B8Z0_9LAMI|nr:hypothetical protein F511_23019 [Dorcoceras hygrometricum]
MMRRRAGESADGLVLMTSSVTSSYSADGLSEQSQESADLAGRLCVDFSSRKLQWIQSQRKDFQSQWLYIQTQEDKSNIVEEDSGEAIDEPDASNSSIQSRAYMNQLLLRIQKKKKFYRGFIYRGDAIEEIDVSSDECVKDVGATTAQLQKYIEYTVHQQREKEEKDDNRPPLEKSFSRESIAESRLAC